MDKWRTLQRDVLHTRQPEQVDDFTDMMEDVYQVFQHRGYFLQDTSLGDIDSDIKDGIFQLCVSVLKLKK